MIQSGRLFIGASVWLSSGVVLPAHKLSSYCLRTGAVVNAPAEQPAEETPAGDTIVSRDVKAL
jgi:hypothetical protein